MSNPTSLSLFEQANLLEKKEISSSELTELYLKNIKENEDLNCFISLNEHALDEARKIDKLRNRKSSVQGIPIAHKDIFCAKGYKTTCGSKMLENFTSPYSSTVFDKLNTSKTIMLGKTNMDEFAMGSSNETSYFGKVKNPIDKLRSPGGSSGGSAAAVKANLCAFATGTDTGGSIRQPASFCGVTGIKPTYGRVSRWGMIAFASSLDQAGIFAKSALDASIALEVISGFDEKDSTSIQKKVPNFRDETSSKMNHIIGIPYKLIDKIDDSNIKQNFLDAINTLEKNKGKTTLKFREIMSSKAFGLTAYYDAMIANWFNNKLKIKFPERKTIFGRRLKKLRYGENPHQEGSIYVNDYNDRELNFAQLHVK